MSSVKDFKGWIKTRMKNGQCRVGLEVCFAYVFISSHSELHVTVQLEIPFIKKSDRSGGCSLLYFCE